MMRVSREELLGVYSTSDTLLPLQHMSRRWALVTFYVYLIN